MLETRAENHLCMKVSDGTFSVESDTLAVTLPPNLTDSSRIPLCVNEQGQVVELVRVLFRGSVSTCCASLSRLLRANVDMLDQGPPLDLPQFEGVCRPELH